MKDKFTITEIREYFEGWDMAGFKSAALHNALLMLEDDQDGIVAYFNRKEHYAQKIHKQHALLKEAQEILRNSGDEEKVREICGKIENLLQEP
jgi:antirestriction protein